MHEIIRSLSIIARALVRIPQPGILFHDITENCAADSKRAIADEDLVRIQVTLFATTPE